MAWRVNAPLRLRHPTRPPAPASRTPSSSGQEVQKLPDEDKALVKSFLDAFLFKRKVEGMSLR